MPISIPYSKTAAIHIDEYPLHEAIARMADVVIQNGPYISGRSDNALAVIGDTANLNPVAENFILSTMSSVDTSNSSWIRPSSCVGDWGAAAAA